MPDDTWNYFVSYSLAGGFGNCVIDLKRPVTEIADVNYCAAVIAQVVPARSDDVVVLNLVLLSSPEPAGPAGTPSPDQPKDA